MKLAAILAAVLSFFAGMWVLREYQKHVPPFDRDPEWTLRRDPVWPYNPVAYWPLRESDDWASDPRTAELATGGGQEGANS